MGNKIVEALSSNGVVPYTMLEVARLTAAAQHCWRVWRKLCLDIFGFFVFVLFWGKGHCFSQGKESSGC